MSGILGFIRFHGYYRWRNALGYGQRGTGIMANPCHVPVRWAPRWWQFVRLFSERRDICGRNSLGTHHWSHLYRASEFTTVQPIDGHYDDDPSLVQHDRFKAMAEVLEAELAAEREAEEAASAARWEVFRG